MLLKEWKRNKEKEEGVKGSRIATINEERKGSE